MKQLLIVLAAFSVVGIVTTERVSCLKRVAFSSTNFENILTWETEADIPPGTVFDVQYKQYGEKSWLAKPECQGISQPFCNLTRETENFTEQYYGRARAAGGGCSAGWVRSERFEPRKETVIGAPQVEFVPQVRSVRFRVRPPRTALRGQDGRPLALEDIYGRLGALHYHLTMVNLRTRQQWTKNEHSKEFEVSNLDPDTEYNGTVYIDLLQRSSKAQVFWVKTLEDKTWLLYCLVALGFCAGLVFAATTYVIYRYVKHHSAQPMALDFRGISSFQPLTLTVEHIIKPLSLSKPSLFVPEVQLSQISQHLDQALEPPWALCAPQTGYQQQAEVPAVPLPPQPPCRDIVAPAGYAPQGTPCAPRTALPLTYGLCGQGSDHENKNVQPERALKEVSPERFVDGKLPKQVLGETCSHWNYREQQPKVALWRSRDRTEPGPCQGGPGQTELLLLKGDGQENTERVPQLSLSLLEQGGCYRQQAAELPLLLSAVKAATDYVSEDELVPPLPAPLLLSLRTGTDLPGEGSSERWLLPGLFSHPADQGQLPEPADTGLLPAAGGLSCTDLSLSPHTVTASGHDTGTALTMLFKDLDLRVQWDEDGNTECY
ncbi:interleukin-22 receptor subunit alpha-1 [Pithys albifrons albifrons]|uniref:interleukin-22 receptor subunit alpha-1 n=1 Tax=Pithys albifrons albifrons TaxID=3385563 RepID=UPI003A5CE254